MALILQSPKLSLCMSHPQQYPFPGCPVVTHIPEPCLLEFLVSQFGAGPTILMSQVSQLLPFV